MPFTYPFLYLETAHYMSRGGGCSRSAPASRYFQPNRVIKGPAQLLWVSRSSGLSGGVVCQGLYTFSPWNCCCCVQVQVPISSGWDSSAIPVPLAPPRAVWATSAQRSSYFCHGQTTSPHPQTHPLPVSPQQTQLGCCSVSRFWVRLKRKATNFNNSSQTSLPKEQDPEWTPRASDRGPKLP